MGVYSGRSCDCKGGSKPYPRFHGYNPTKNKS